MQDEHFLGEFQRTKFDGRDALAMVCGKTHASIIEIGGRMGGDFIGSDLVELSTGYDFVKGVIKVAMGEDPEVPETLGNSYAGVNFVINQDDVEAYKRFKEEHPGTILREHIDEDLSDMVTDSSNRHGYYIFKF